MTSLSRSKVTVWGQTNCAPPPRVDVVLWSRFADRDEQVSLPSVIHADRSGWKAQYTDWLRQVGQSYSRTQQARDFEDNHAGLSYWWMTLPTQFTFTRDSPAYGVMRLMALIDTLIQKQPDVVVLHGMPPDAVACVEPWCIERGIVVDVPEAVSCVHPSPGSGAFRARAVARRHLMMTYARYGHATGPRSQDGPVVVDYFDNVKPGGDRYDSQYWGSLADLLDGDGSTQWRHIDFRSAALPTSASARALARRLTTGSRHSLVQDAMSLRLLLRSLKTLRSIESIGRDAWSAVSFVEPSRDIDFRPLVADVWRDCHSGPKAAVNALDIHLMDALASTTHGPALYLMENQPWEMALLHSWRRHQQAPIAGFVHALARDWDLRYALPSCGPVGGAMPPMPDQCLVGSSHEAAVLTEDGYTANTIVEVEAVRFLGAQSTPRQPTTSAGSLRLLALGEYDEHSNELLLQALHGADLDGLSLIYRPHPSSRFAPAALPIGFTMSSQPTVAEALAEADAVVGMGTSTAVLSAVQSALPVIMILDPTVLDGSVVDPSAVLQVPASIRLDSHLVERARQLAERVTTQRLQHLDEGLPRWRAWLGERRN